MPSTQSELKEADDIMRLVAQHVDAALNGHAEVRRNGFVILVFPFEGEVAKRTNYISNCQRGDMVQAMKEVVARFEAGEVK